MDKNVHVTYIINLNENFPSHSHSVSKKPQKISRTIQYDLVRFNTMAYDKQASISGVGDAQKSRALKTSKKVSFSTNCLLNVIENSQNRY